MSQRPRILLFSTAYLPLIGGSELAIHHIAQRLKDYDFDLITKRYSVSALAVEQMDRVRVFRVRSPKFFLPLTLMLKAFSLSASHRYSLLHAYQASHAAGAAWLVHRMRPSLPFLVTLQEGKALEKQSLPVRWSRALILWSATRITAISSYLADYARRYSRAPIDIIPNGVTIRDVPNVGNPDPTILTVSRLVPKNNVEGVIRAFAIVRNTIPNARLLIVGDGPLRQELEVLCSELGVRKAADFRGLIPHDSLASVYAAADVFVRPSLSEGLGSVFLEAMASRVPVVASSVGGITDIVKDGQTGLLCKAHDPADIAKAIVRLLEDRPLRENIVRNSEIMVREKYDWNIIARQMGQVYQGLLNA